MTLQRSYLRSSRSTRITSICSKQYSNSFHTIYDRNISNDILHIIKRRNKSSRRNPSGSFIVKEILFSEKRWEWSCSVKLSDVRRKICDVLMMSWREFSFGLIGCIMRMPCKFMEHAYLRFTSTCASSARAIARIISRPQRRAARLWGPQSQAAAQEHPFTFEQTLLENS